MREFKGQEILIRLEHQDIAAFTIPELSRLKDFLETMFNTEIVHWYSSISSGDVFNGRMHYVCANIINKHIQDISRFVASKNIESGHI
jgi:hypothetical protein